MIEVTLLTNANGPLSKHISLGEAGRVVSDGSRCLMSEGRAARAPLTGPEDLARRVGAMPVDQAIALGRLRDDLPAEVPLVAHRRLQGGSAPAGAIARTRHHIGDAAGRPAFALLDFDRKGMPDSVARILAAEGGFWPALARAVPAIAPAARVRRASTSAGLFDVRTGERIGSAVGGEHVYVQLGDGADAERFLRDIHERCWLHGLGWYTVGAAGQLLERSVVDRTVGAPERLIFEGPPVLEPPLGQDRAAREPEWAVGEALDTSAACPPLTVVERAWVAELKEAAKAALAPEAARVRAAADRVLAERLAERGGMLAPSALRVAETRHRGVLLPGIELAFDDPEVGAVTVADVLAHPGRFEGETLADPLEGVAYGRCKAMVMRRPDGAPWIHSFAHGRTTYDLRLDAAALEAILRGTESAAVVDAYVRLLSQAELQPDEQARLSDLVCQLSGTKARPLAARVRAERERRAEEEEAERRRAAAQARAAERAGHRRRTRLPAPLPDAERTPVLQALDEVLGAVAEPEPPMRNADGAVAEVRARRPWGLHGLTDAGADAEETPEDRLPPPEEPLVTALDAVGLDLLVERHVEHYRLEDGGGERAVALPEPFLRAYLCWRGGRLPTVRAVVTAPLVTREGALLAGAGLDRAREVVFRIEPGLRALVPADPGAIADSEVVEALRFLLDEWLCDVATGFAGRIVLLAYALTIIERVLLPERPAFFVTAGQRGGGKTTVLTMLVLAVLGQRPPAAAWSPSAEERRKALLAYLGEAVATLIWDNIERGTAISCPSVEKALTAAEYTDQILKASRSATVPSTTVLAFTGNNIAPKGDMASRSLVCRLEVERPDPENRAFRHPDPVGWTLANRARILRALYTLLRWNPQVRMPRAEQEPSKTRFKIWWDLVGAPLEVAAMLAQEAQAEAARPGGAPFRCAPEAVDFGALFAAGEAEEEETSGMRELVLLLRGAFGEGLFGAAEVAARMQAPPVPVLSGQSPGEDERPAGAEPAQPLRAALEAATGRPLRPGATPHAVAKRLQMVVGRPVALGGGEVGTVLRARADHEANTYRVTIARGRSVTPPESTADGGRPRRTDPAFPAFPAGARECRERRDRDGGPRRPEPGESRVSGVASDPAELLRRLRPRAGAAAPAAGVHVAPAGTPGAGLGGAAAGAGDGPARSGAVDAPAAGPRQGAPGPRACMSSPDAAAAAAALLRAADAAAEALAEPDGELAREREEVAAGLRVEAPDPTRAGMAETLPNGTHLCYCHACGRLAAWGSLGTAHGRGRAGRWSCPEHAGRGG